MIESVGRAKPTVAFEHFDFDFLGIFFKIFGDILPLRTNFYFLRFRFFNLKH